MDEADYESIVSQVRNDEFREELGRREEAIRRELEASHKASDAEAETAHIKAMGEKRKVNGNLTRQARCTALSFSRLRHW